MELPKYFYFRVKSVNHGTAVEVEDASDVDVVEVVRCNDCKYYSEDGWGYGNCYRPNVEYLRMADNDYCSFGERRRDVD